MGKPLYFSRFIVLPILALAIGPAVFASANSSKTPPCSAPEYREFDFWLGDWDVFDIDASNNVAPNASAHVRVDSILDGCVLHEVYEDPTGHRGQSFTIYDGGRKLWHQTWVTNNDQLLVIEGSKQGVGIQLNGSYHNAAGAEIKVHGTWRPVTGGVRETAGKSSDGGKTWVPWFDLMFRPRAKASADDDARAVASLDTQYQAAVKKNDADTMERMLADDFVLVTGSGKSYSKADLVGDARTGTSSYEHNEELEQKVRIWGDTAVVTAKLWEKGVDRGSTFDHTAWFSDTYVRTPAGWKYVFGQSSLSLPKTAQ